MVSLVEDLRVSLGTGPRPGDRLVLDSGEPPISIVYDTLSTSGCSGNRCDGNGLEQMEQDLSVSSDESAFEGFTEADIIPRPRSSSCTQLAKESMVSSPVREESDQSQLHRPSTSASGTRSDSLRLILSESPPSYVDFLAGLYGNRFKPENIKLLTGHVRSSSANQYQSCWKSWIEFVQSKKPYEITEDFMMSYFRFLSEHKGFRIGTIRSHKAALRDPLKMGFNLELRDDLFLKMSKSLALARPVSPLRIISWSLEKVLDHLADLDISDCSLKDLLDKTIFLIALASGGRVSEISALQRGREYTCINPAGVLVLRPGHGFLAKNEDPCIRRDPWRIPPLPGEDNSLCPVANIQAYLHRTAEHTSGYLFRHHSSSKPLSVCALRVRLTSLIKRTNPQSVPKAHDVRKMASSLAFFTDMSYQCISQMTGWSSTAVFVKHYLSSIDSVLHCVGFGSYSWAEEF